MTSRLVSFAFLAQASVATLSTLSMAGMRTMGRDHYAKHRQHNRSHNHLKVSGPKIVLSWASPRANRIPSTTVRGNVEVSLNLFNAHPQRRTSELLRKHGVIKNSDNVDSASQSCYLSASGTTVSRDTIWVATSSASIIKNEFGTSFWLYSGVYCKKLHPRLFSGLRKWGEGSWDVSISYSGPAYDFKDSSRKSFFLVN